MGSAMKVVNNYMGNVLAVLTAETVNLAEAAGLERDLALSVLRETAAGKGMLNRWPNKVWAGDTSPGFMIDLASKDVGLGLELAYQLGSPALTGAGARQGQSLARMLGYGRQDNSALYLAMRDLRQGKTPKA